MNYNYTKLCHWLWAVTIITVTNVIDYEHTIFFFHVKVLTPSQMIDLKEAISTEIEEMYRKVSILHQTS